MMLAALRFSGNLPTWLVFVLAIAGAAGVLLYYLRETRSLDSPANFLVPSLRAAAIALAILTLAAPTWQRKVTIGTLGQVTFAVDVSQSMSVTDSKGDPDSPNRLRRIISLLQGGVDRPGWIEQLSSTHDVEVLAFSAGSPAIVSMEMDKDGGFTSEVIDSDSEDGETDSEDGELDSLGSVSLQTLSADAAYTDLSSAMKSAMASLNSSSTGDQGDGDPFDSSQQDESADQNEDVQRAAIVVMSDGRDNTGASPVDFAKRARGLGAQVFTIGMGSEDELVDVGITGIDHPSNVAAEGLMDGEISLEQYSLDDRPLNVQIETSDGDVVWQRQVTPSQGSSLSVPFQLDLQSLVSKIRSDTPRGINRSTVVLDLRAVVSVADQADADTNSRNDSRPFRVAASTRDRRLLILDGSSRWETRYLRNLFQRDPSWNVDTVLFGPGTDQERIVRGESPGQFPADAETMAGYDAIVLGEIPSEQFAAFDQDLIRQFVARGGGLIIIDGAYDQIRRIADAKFGELIPVQYSGKQSMPVASVRPTRIGADQPLMSLTSDRDQSESFWAALPPPTMANVVTPKPGAEVWGEVVNQNGDASPWLTTTLFGSGRIFHLSTDQTWRWRYKVADRIHARFWNQLLSAVMQPPYSASDDYVSIGTDKIEYGVGEQTQIRARLQGPSGSPISDATVDAIVIRDNQVVATIPLSVDDANRGSYQGAQVLPESGKYDIRIRASGFDTSTLQASTPIWVFPKDSTEWSRVSLDRRMMQNVARSGGGEYFHESNAAGVLDLLRPLSSGQTVESEFLLWQSYYWFIAIVALLAAEWYLRKRSGLV